MKEVGGIRWCELEQGRIHVYRKPQQQKPEDTFSLAYRVLELRPTLGDSDDGVQWVLKQQRDGATKFMSAPDAETATMWIKSVQEEMKMLVVRDIEKGMVSTTSFSEDKSASIDTGLARNLFNQKLKVWVGTWNLGSEVPSGDLRTWIKPEEDHGAGSTPSSFSRLIFAAIVQIYAYLVFKNASLQQELWSMTRATYKRF